MASWVMGADPEFGYEFSGLTLDEAARRAPLVVQAAWISGLSFVTLYHGTPRIPATGRYRGTYGRAGSVKRELHRQFREGRWRPWAYVAQTPRHTITGSWINVAIKPNPEPDDWAALPDFETHDGWKVS
jgi:hypothetical protein